MKLKKRWLLAILISFAQLAVMLVGVIYLSNHVETEYRSFAEKQVFQNNQSLALGYAEQWKSAQRTVAGTKIDETAANRIWERLRVPEESVLGLINLDSGECVRQAGNTGLKLPEKTIGQMVVQSESGKKILGHEVVSHPPGYVLSGRMMEQDQVLISVTRVGTSSYAIAIAQDQSSVESKVQSLVSWLRRLGFAITLLVGLACTSLSAIVLRRYDETLASQNNKLEQQVENRSRSLMKTKNAIIFGLAKLAESRDTDTGEHLDRIRRYVILLATQLQETQNEIDEKYISNIGFASSLHDIGKVGIPDGILLKPGALTADERFIMEQHAVIGGECLEAIESKLGEDKFLEMARKIAYAHHERWDGTGYPFKLAGHDIPLEARIVSVADVYDALTTKRPYKRALTHEESKAIIISGVGTQFDPEVVEAFLAQEDNFREIAENQAGDAMPAIMAIDHSLISSPVANPS